MEAVTHVPNALEKLPEIEHRLTGKRAFVFLDYDGTLSPIAPRPDLALLSDKMRDILHTLAARCTVAIVSGRDLENVHKLVGLDDLIYAGSHGFDIAGPNDLRIQHEQGAVFLEAVQRATQRLCPALAGIDGTLVEPKRFAVAVHYRQVDDKDVTKVEAIIDDVLQDVSELRKTHGKKVFELRPRFDWDKGKAVLWLLEALKDGGPEDLPFFIGDDLTDEDAFTALRGKGVTIYVGHPQETAAAYLLADTDQVGTFLSKLAKVVDHAHRR